MTVSVSVGRVAAPGNLPRLGLRWEGDTALGGRGGWHMASPFGPWSAKSYWKSQGLPNEDNLG